MRTMDDGSIVFPERGKPPPDLPNWDRDPGDPYRFTPAYVPCMHRTTLQQVKPCGKTYTVPFCSLKAVLISVPFCKACDVEPKI